jgi:hypothetical protein
LFDNASSLLNCSNYLNASADDAAADLRAWRRWRDVTRGRMDRMKDRLELVGGFGQTNLPLQNEETGELSFFKNICIALQYKASDRDLTEEEEVAARAQVIIIAGIGLFIERYCIF